MAMTVWKRVEDITAFGHGREAALEGFPRIATRFYSSYNERAAFNDGWDSIMKARPLPPSTRRRRPVMPK